MTTRQSADDYTPIHSEAEIPRIPNRYTFFSDAPAFRGVLCGSQTDFFYTGDRHFENAKVKKAYQERVSQNANQGIWSFCYRG